MDKFGSDLTHIVSDRIRGVNAVDAGRIVHKSLADTLDRCKTHDEYEEVYCAYFDFMGKQDSLVPFDSKDPYEETYCHMSRSGRKAGIMLTLHLVKVLEAQLTVLPKFCPDNHVTTRLLCEIKPEYNKFRSEWLLKLTAIAKIKLAWRSAAYDPKRSLCKSRLLKKFLVLQDC